MTAEVLLTGDAADRIATAFAATSRETLAVGYAGVARTQRVTRLLVHRVELPDPEAYRQRGAGHLSIAPSYVATVALRAQSLGLRPVFFHSHPGSIAPAFSGIDARTHDVLMPSLLRQTDAPVGSVVWGPGGWGAAIWDGPGEQEASISVSGRRLQTFRRDAAVDAQPYARQMLAFGSQAQRVLGSLRVGIVGLGGTGSLTAQSAAHLGVRDFVLVDADHIEPSNLSRVVGSGPAALGAPKVEVAARLIRAIAPDAQLDAHVGDVRDCDQARALRTCDVIFGCTDSHSSRTILNQLAYQYAITVIDMGSLLRVHEGGVEAAFADVRLARIGLSCLLCAGSIDTAAASAELRSEADRERYRERGYVTGDTTGPVPSVLPLNAITAGLASLRLVDLVAPWTEWETRVTVELRQLRVVERTGSADPSCPVCGRDAPIARGDDVPLRCRGPQ